MSKKKTQKARPERAAALADPGAAVAAAGPAAPAVTAPAAAALAADAPAAFSPDAAVARGHGWTFLTNHGHVLVCLAREPGLRVRDVATRVGITERAAVRIVGDLVAAGYLERRRVGRRNEYALRLDRPMRHPVEAQASVRALVDSVVAS